MNIHTVDQLSDPAQYQEKEHCYIQLRRREGRVLPDEVVKSLPYVSKSNPNAKEWTFRRRSFERLFRHLVRNPGRLNILDLGCGNGWMSNRLAENPDWKVQAVDLNLTELEQGARLFGRENLRFSYADVLENLMPENHFDIIVLAASVQYFPELENLISTLHKLLTINGEIHILDSPFYQSADDQAAARQRTFAYYTQVGVPEMAQFYHHHLWAEALQMGAKDLNKAWKTRFLMRLKWLGPFPWVRFNKIA